MFDKDLIAKWAMDAPTYEFEPLGELKILKLIYFLIKEGFKIDDKNANAQDFYNLFMKDKKFACKQYVIFKKIIDPLFSDYATIDDLLNDLGIHLKSKTKKTKPKAKKEPKKKNVKKKDEIKSNVVNFSDYKKKAG